MNENVRKTFWKIAVPSILGMLIVSMQIMVDGIFVSYGVGSIGLAAVNLSMPLINTVFSIGLMVTVGGVVLAGIAQGEGNLSRVKQLTTLTFALQYIIILFLTLLFFLFRPQVLDLMGADADVYPYMSSYLSVMMAGSVLYNAPITTESFMRLTGRPNWVFVSAVICCLVNILLDYLFVIHYDMGMSGAAYATCIANLIGALALIGKIHFGPLHINLRDIRNILYNGSSEMLTTLSAAVAIYVFNIVLMRDIGSLGVSALTVVFYVNALVNITLFGLAQALQPIVSHNVGAARYDKVHQVVRIAMKAGLAMSVVSFAVMFFFSSEIIALFVHGDESLQAIADEAMFFAMFAFLISFINILSSTLHTAIEKPLESAAIALSRSIGFVLLYLMILPPLFGQIGIWLTIPLAELSCVLISLPWMIYSIRKLKSRQSITK